jgi:hypothetical protein
MLLHLATPRPLPGTSRNGLLSDAHMNRVIATRDRFKQTPAFRNIVPGTDLTTGSIKHHEQMLNPAVAEGMVLVCWSVSDRNLIFKFYLVKILVSLQRQTKVSRCKAWLWESLISTINIYAR